MAVRVRSPPPYALGPLGSSSSSRPCTSTVTLSRMGDCTLLPAFSSVGDLSDLVDVADALELPADSGRDP